MYIYMYIYIYVYVYIYVYNVGKATINLPFVCHFFGSMNSKYKFSLDNGLIDHMYMAKPSVSK